MKIELPSELVAIKETMTETAQRMHAVRNDQIGKVIRTVLENDAQTHALLKDWLARLKENEI